MIKSTLSAAAVTLLLAGTSLVTASAQDAPQPVPLPAPPSQPATDAAPVVAGTSEKYAAVVRIENNTLNPDYRTPWNAGREGGGNGTGFLVAKNRFLTNAHVVSNSQVLYIKKVGDAKPYAARILHIAHDCDLAMLEVEDYSAFEDVPFLPIGGLPKLETTVKVIGYPVGGERISVTRGVVSRIDFNSYSHSTIDQHLTVQIDAAINPGNSGGPVLQDGKVVGVAFQGYSGAVAQNTGYMIPVPVIERFLKDVEDGKYDHYVDLSTSDFALVNPAQRSALGLPNNGIGVMVADAEEGGSAGGILQTGDVLLAIDGHPIKSNGLIHIAGENVNMNEIVERKFAGDKIKLKIWRDRKELDVEVVLKRYEPYLIGAAKYDEKPRYVAFCGLVFQPLDRNLMRAHGLNTLQMRYYFNYYATDGLYKERPEIVVLTTILPDAINNQLGSFAKKIVDEINGTKIKTLNDVYDALNIIDETREFVEIKVLGEGRPIVLDTTKTKDAHARILQEYRVKKDHFLGE